MRSFYMAKVRNKTMETFHFLTLENIWFNEVDVYIT